MRARRAWRRGVRHARRPQRVGPARGGEGGGARGRGGVEAVGAADGLDAGWEAGGGGGGAGRVGAGAMGVGLGSWGGDRGWRTARDPASPCARPPRARHAAALGHTRIAAGAARAGARGAGTRNGQAGHGGRPARAGRLPGFLAQAVAAWAWAWGGGWAQGPRGAWWGGGGGRGRDARHVRRRAGTTGVLCGYATRTRALSGKNDEGK